MGPPGWSVPRTSAVKAAGRRPDACGELMLDGDEKPLLPAILDQLGPRSARLIVAEGRYHQVRRMFAAVGNHVVSLHRERIGGLALPEDLPPGAYCVLRAEEAEAVFLAEPPEIVSAVSRRATGSGERQVIYFAPRAGRRGCNPEDKDPCASARSPRCLAASPWPLRSAPAHHRPAPPPPRRP